MRVEPAVPELRLGLCSGGERCGTKGRTQQCTKLGDYRNFTGTGAQRGEQSGTVPGLPACGTGYNTPASLLVRSWSPLSRVAHTKRPDTHVRHHDCVGTQQAGYPRPPNTDWYIRQVTITTNIHIYFHPKNK